MLRAALRTYPSMNIFMFGWRTNDFAHSYRNGYGRRRKISWWQLSPWLSFCREENASPKRKLKRYGLLKMCYFCVMFGFWSNFLQKSSNDLVFAWEWLSVCRVVVSPNQSKQIQTNREKKLVQYASGCRSDEWLSVRANRNKSWT